MFSTYALVVKMLCILVQPWLLGSSLFSFQLWSFLPLSFLFPPEKKVGSSTSIISFPSMDSRNKFLQNLTKFRVVPLAVPNQANKIVIWMDGPTKAATTNAPIWIADVWILRLISLAAVTRLSILFFKFFQPLCFLMTFLFFFKFLSTLTTQIYLCPSCHYLQLTATPS